MVCLPQYTQEMASFLVDSIFSPRWLSAQVEDKRFISIGVFASGDCRRCHTVSCMIQTSQQIASAILDFPIHCVTHNLSSLFSCQILQFFPNSFCADIYAIDFQRSWQSLRPMPEWQRFLQLLCYRIALSFPM